MRPRIWVPIAVVVAVLLFGLPLIFNIAADWLWFDSQSLSSVYITRFTTQWLVGIAGTILAAIFLAVNLQVARRNSTPGQIFEGQQATLSAGSIRQLIWAATLVLAIFFGLAAGGEWVTVLRFLNATPFGGSPDRIFQQDVGFYVFTLPFLDDLRGWISSLILFTGVAVIAVYAVGSRLTMPTVTRPAARRLAEDGSPETMLNQLGLPQIDLPAAARPHLTILGALWLLTFAFGYFLDRYKLLFNQREGSTAFAGVGYTDENARITASWILLVVVILVALTLLLTIRSRNYRLPLYSLGAWLLVAILVGGVYPTFVQQFQVNANIFDKESKYADNNIKATRSAFNLDIIEERPGPTAELTRADLAASPQTVKNVRLWDYRQLEQSYQQLQAISTYFNFSEVTIDRYTLGSDYRQVMLAARELDQNKVNGLNWPNRHLQYTHGLGVALSPVNEAVGEGSPRLFVRDIPPVSSYPNLNLSRPEIYYGLQTDDYVFVKTTATVFQGNEGVISSTGSLSSTTTATNTLGGGYEGSGGVALDSYWKKLLYSYHFGDGNILLSDALKDDSRILYNRDVQQMTNLVAPFLLYDDDPYLVIADGKLYWIRDAYTISDRYPNATVYTGTIGGFNYIRNSVKVVIDAYSGKMAFYAFDENEPILKTYSKIFPDLFKPRSAMPANLVAHVRYPELLFNVQAQTLELYHMTEPQVFLRRQDPWTVATDGTPNRNRNANAGGMEPYYNIMKLRGDESESFLLLLPFTPAGKPNMTAWMAAKSDGADYGKIVVIRFPAGNQVSGPQQVVARANQDPSISQLRTLLGQRGSNVELGNLLVLPIGQSILYVQPLYVTAEQNPQPELKYVIVASTNRVTIASTFDEAINKLLSGQGSAIEQPGTGVGTGTPTANGTPGPQPTAAPQPTIAGGTDLATLSAPQLVSLAQQQYERGQAALRANDFATYGQAQAELKRTLDELARRIGTPAP